MCSALSSPSADECLSELDRKARAKLEERIADFAADANPEKAGALDRAPMHDMPDELRGVKKQRVGRHRVYYTGHHAECSYTLHYVKLNKKDDVDPEHDKAFQGKLAKALKAGGEPRVIRIEDERSQVGL